MKKSIEIGILAALLSARLAFEAEAATPPADLIALEEFAEEGRWSEMTEYLEANPELLLGDDTLAKILRDAAENDVRLSTVFAFDETRVALWGRSEFRRSWNRSRAWNRNLRRWGRFNLPPFARGHGHHGHY